MRPKVKRVIEEVNIAEESFHNGIRYGMKKAHEDFRETVRVCSELCEAVLMDWPNKTDIARNAQIHLNNIKLDDENLH